MVLHSFYMGASRRRGGRARRRGGRGRRRWGRVRQELIAVGVGCRSGGSRELGGGVAAWSGISSCVRQVVQKG